MANKLGKVGTLAAMFVREKNADELGQGHHQSMIENPARIFTRTPEVRVLIILTARRLNECF